MHTLILPTTDALKSLRKQATAAFARVLRWIRMNPETSYAGFAPNFPSKTLTA